MTQAIKTYSVVQKGSFGPAHPMFDPRVVVYLYDEAGKLESTKIMPSGEEGHLWALEQGYSLPEGHRLLTSARYQEWLAQVRYRRSGL